MKERIIIGMLAVLVVSMGMGCGAPEKKIVPTSVERTSPEAEPISVKESVETERKLPEAMASPETTPISVRKHTLPQEPLLTVKATLQANDVDRRVVTLKDGKGNVFDLKVGEEVTSLPQMKIGDEVLTKYYEWSALSIKKVGERKARAVRNPPRTPKPGQGPVGVVRESLTVKANVETIDHARTHVTIKQPDGSSTTIFVRRPRALDNVKQGDSVTITYIEALAISMEKVK